MSNVCTIDREAFQHLLANAFAVQSSRIDRESLSSVLEIQQSIMSGDLDLAGALNLIADRTRDVADAAGIAIGLLQGDHLSYHAGSGSAENYRGRQVKAALVVSTGKFASREIIRVENAHADNRIESEICRQFGDTALLVMLTYRDRAPAGVLEVHFNEAHCFEDREVRCYRLMAGLVEEAMLKVARRGSSKTTETKIPTKEQSGDEKDVIREGREAVETGKHAVAQKTGATPRIEEHANSTPLHKSRLMVAMLVTAFLIAAYVSYAVRRSLSWNPAQRSGTLRQSPAVRPSFDTQVSQPRKRVEVASKSTRTTPMVVTEAQKLPKPSALIPHLAAGEPSKTKTQSEIHSSDKSISTRIIKGGRNPTQMSSRHRSSKIRASEITRVPPAETTPGVEKIHRTAAKKEDAGRPTSQSAPLRSDWTTGDKKRVPIQQRDLDAQPSSTLQLRTSANTGKPSLAGQSVVNGAEGAIQNRRDDVSVPTQQPNREPESKNVAGGAYPHTTSNSHASRVVTTYKEPWRRFRHRPRPKRKDYELR